MKKNVYTRVSGLLLLSLLYFTPFTLLGQNCNTVSFTCATQESRCMATGAITVQASGGSGNYNYKVSGPVVTSFTSSNSITGLPAGTYKVIVRDINGNCQTEKDGVVVTGSYSDPRFLLLKTDVSCAGNDGTITVNSQQFGRAPFSYTIVSPSPAGVGTTNTTGRFQHLIAGEYAVQLKDSCGGIQVRRVTLEDYTWWFDGVTVTKTDCNNAEATIRLKDNKGSLNTTSTEFAGFMYGLVVAEGDTTWFASNKFQFYTGSKRSVTFIAKDPCGNAQAYIWNVPANAKPSVGNVAISNTTCERFTATVNGQQNLTNPQFRLFNAGNTEIEANTTGVFTSLLYGDYCIRIEDACYDTTIIKCFTANQPAPSVNSTVHISNEGCTTFIATVTGQANLTNPQYCLYDADSALVSCNSTGAFPNIAYGSYCIKTTDGCTNAVLNRCFTAAKPLPVLAPVSITSQNCTSFDATASGNHLVDPQYCLYDSLGNVIACNATGVFTGIPNGDYCIRAASCGDTTDPVCFSGVAPKPAVAATVQFTNKACSSFTAKVTGQVHFTAAHYCLYDTADVQLACNTTGVFDSLAYGAYCIKITDACYDTTIIRCFSQARPVPAVNATLQQLNGDCTTFTAKVTGQQNLFNPLYCLYDAQDNELQCNTTGIFEGLPYGTYCVTIKDACTDTTLRICQTFSYKYNLNITNSKSCAIGSANVAVSFIDGNGPFITTVFHPDGSLVFSDTTTTTAHAVLPALPDSTRYMIIGTDHCGQRDTAMLLPDVSIITKNITAISKCPSSVWLDGSGDLSVNSGSNFSTVTPKIIKKDGATFSKTHSSNTGINYVFSDLEPASYIVEYRIENCGAKLYDTFAVQPYTYPTQGRSAIYQCDNKSISLSADVTGGVGPYNYQIIGSVPEMPSIVSPQQTDPQFLINTGTTYSLVRLRTVDACGNATLNDISILPLQNIQITADTTCLFSNVTLTVDTIPDATYSWYLKRTPGDSVFITNDKTYNIPFMQQQDAGTYICKVELNNGCLTRHASFMLSGDCDVYLPVPFELSGKSRPEGNVLSWIHPEPQKVHHYEIERKLYERNSFTRIGRFYAEDTTAQGSYRYTDTTLRDGRIEYRVKAVLQNGLFEYTNTVGLLHERFVSGVYPNPVYNSLTVAINGTKAATYEVRLYNTAGRIVYQQKLQNVSNARHRYQRNGLPRGMYILTVTNVATGETTHNKLFFD
jgi:hypothetical protein